MTNSVLKHMFDSRGNPKGMPRTTYTSTACFDFEREQLFTKNWVAVAYQYQLPEPSYTLPIDFMGWPLLITRDTDDQIRVFHNVCSHRGMKLVASEGRTNLMVCPYHAWSYDFSGDLKATPHIGGVNVHSLCDFYKQGKGLKEIKSHVWMGIIFIHFQGNAVEFDEFIEPLETRWQQFVGGRCSELPIVDPICGVKTFELQVNCNWKLAVENYCEAYHLPWVHPDLNRYSPLQHHETIIINEHMSGQRSHCYQLAEDGDFSMQKIAQWDEGLCNESEYVALYPNLLLGIQADHFVSSIIRPISPTKSVELGLLQFSGQGAVDEQYEAARQKIVDSWEQIFQEDVFSIESMQQGRSSPAFDGGVFTPVLDGASCHFNHWVAEHYNEADEKLLV